MVRPVFALVLVTLAAGCGGARPALPADASATNGPAQLLSYFVPGTIHVMARLDLARMRASTSEEAWSRVVHLPRVYTLVLGTVAVDPVRELDSMLIVGSGLLYDDSTMLLRLVETGARIRERMLSVSNQQLGWSEADGFVTARWPSESLTERRVIFVAPHEVVLTPTGSVERALEVAHTHRAHAPGGEVVESMLAFSPGELGRLWMDEVPSSIAVAGLHPSNADIVIRELDLGRTEIRIDLGWLDEAEATTARTELARVLTLPTTMPLLTGIARILAAFHVVREDDHTVIDGMLSPTDLDDALSMAYALAGLFL